MPHSEHKITYGEFKSAVTAVGSVATIRNMNPSLLNSFVGIIWYSESTGVTKAVPTAGTAQVEFLEVVTDQWTPALGVPINATDVTDTTDVHANYTQIRVTPTGITGATHYKVLVTANSEDSFPDALIETSDRGSSGAAVFIQDQTTPVLTVPFLQERAIVTLAAATTIDSNVITLVGGHGVTPGEVLELAQVGFSTFMQATVVTVVTNTITLDSPVNAIYETTDVAIASVKDMLVNGAVTPVIFSVLPGPTQAGDMVRIIIELRGTADMDFTTFGSDVALTTGCLLRVKNPDGTFRNLFNFKSNSDFIEQGFDGNFLAPKQGNSTRGFISRVTWGGQSKHGVVIRLDGNLGEELQVVIQDNLTLGVNTRFHLVAQGHELQG